ncbi:MAG: histone-lysine N-methyltransferase, partial [Oceanidesulfovibrio sp.]
MSHSGPPDEPALFRDVFPYGAVARTPLDGRLDPPAPAAHPYIADSTFRDGQQAAPPYRVEAVVALFDLLHRLGGASGLIRTSEFFLYTERDRRAAALCQERGYEHPRVVPWIRAHHQDLDLVRDMGFAEACILLSVSDYHIHYKLGKDRARYREEVLNLADKALAAGIAPRVHLEDITRADIAYCTALARDLAELAGQAGRPLVVRLCDTLGLGVPYPGATLPRSVPRLVRTFIEDAGIPGANLEFHGHNDLHKAFINT